MLERALTHRSRYRPFGLGILTVVFVFGLARASDVAPAQTPSPSSTARVSATSANVPVTAFDGVWDRIGSITFDPNLPSGQLDEPPYNAEYAARYKAILDAAKAGRPFADPTANCLYAGMPRMMNLALPMEIAVIPSRVFIMAEWNGEVRRIYTDGRGHPADPDPTYEGDSIGRWDHGQLRIDTVALRADTRFASAGAPHSDAMTIHERLWLADQNTLKDEITVLDPKAFTRPYVVTKSFRRQPTWTIQEFVCEENNRNPLQNGVTGAILIPKR